MKQNKPLILTDYLSVGEENAITAKDLAKYLGWNERDITITVNALRKQGTLICSNTQSGFGCLLMTEILSNSSDKCKAE